VIHISPNDKFICALCGKPIAFLSAIAYTALCQRASSSRDHGRRPLATRDDAGRR
jgi:hypothetical protein